MLPAAELACIAFESSDVATAGLLRNTLNYVQHAHPVINASAWHLHLQPLPQACNAACLTLRLP